MKTNDWECRIREWSRQKIELLTEQEKLELPSIVLESGYLGYPGATEEQISAAEARLGVTFPPSYREFLKVSNGLRSTSQRPHGLLCSRLEGGILFYSTEDVDWYVNSSQDIIDIWVENRQDEEPIPDEEYFVYNGEQCCFNIRVEYLQTALDISIETDNSLICLLNPQVITSDAEWEAWFFDSHLVDASRYPSFSEMMDMILSNPKSFD